MVRLETTTYVCMLPLNYNFIFTRVILQGTMTILQCIPVTCLCGPNLPVSCNVRIYMALGSTRLEVYVSWKYTCGSNRLAVSHAWKYTSH